ncbi:MAG: GTPase ObgE [SAR324 cluster bacterium]|nr:GTPase ObgE [SAR324 cluster bacterium]
MKFVDSAKINIRSGKGGNGCCSFRREKFVPRGGPNGGDGGNGGTVYFQGNPAKATLLDFQYRQHFRARNGEAGMGKDMHGKNAPPLKIEVPFGTIVSDAETGQELADVVDEQLLLCLKGGRGGKGNARFRTATDRAPLHWEEGEPGEERWVVLELKLMADVGLVGFPNAGKSTLISRISRARPKIADYPFTTLVPNLGVVQTEGYESFVVADLPGIIRGGHEGAGLGLRFLRHIERTALLLILVDGAAMAERQPGEAYRILLEELEAFDAKLLKKPRALALTKMDAAADESALVALREQAAETPVFPISAVSGEGIEALLRFLAGSVNSARSQSRSPEKPASLSIPGR